jgi:hypothetical protein
MLRTTSRPDHQKGRTPNEVGGSRFCFAPEMVLRANDEFQMVDLIFNGASVCMMLYGISVTYARKCVCSTGKKS